MDAIINAIQHWYKKYIKRIEEAPVKLLDHNFHHHKIKVYGLELRNPELTLEERAKAALYIGTLAYTGGISAADLASDYIRDMIDVLIMPDTSSSVRIPVLKGIAAVCYINYGNQSIAKENHLSDVLLACLDEDEDDPDAELDLIIVKFWACYVMTIVCCNNLPNIKLFQDSGGQTLEERLESLSRMEWFGWPENYAEVMFELLGYQKEEDDS
ncbi:armadillo-like helical domain-containing protein 2 [Hemicordylus capensis]|uniref:armadillo-like helical domain-containing protein 2 n=1 Tax=Hemicordylus capensis TaxID=884348 RepID=UPI002302C608|nr:armadillo-like helical domain-containing protein 2 [Hemicordylus capensis]